VLRRIHKAEGLWRLAIDGQEKRRIEENLIDVELSLFTALIIHDFSRLDRVDTTAKFRIWIPKPDFRTLNFGFVLMFSHSLLRSLRLPNLRRHLDK
jgi:hypothetical protein